MLTPGQALVLALAGLVAGVINVVVGSGTLVTFPVLLALGYPPLVANVSNNIGLVPGSLAGVVGYRRELAGQRGRALRLGAAAALGGVVGAGLLLALPPGVFAAAVPALIGLAVVLVLVQPLVARRVAERHARSGTPVAGPGLAAGIAVTGVYGGYFGAAQGVLMLGLMGLALPDDVQRLNALKNVLALTVNLVAGVVFVALADEVAWPAVLLLAAGATVGGRLGAALGRRLPAPVLRGTVAVVGITAAVTLLLR